VEIYSIISKILLEIPSHHCAGLLPRLLRRRLVNLYGFSLIRTHMTASIQTASNSLRWCNGRSPASRVWRLGGRPSQWWCRGVRKGLRDLDSKKDRSRSPGVAGHAVQAPFPPYWSGCIFRLTARARRFPGLSEYLDSRWWIFWSRRSYL